MQYADFRARKENKVYFKMVEEKNRRWCTDCKGMKTLNKDLYMDADGDGKFDMKDLEARKLERAKIAKIDPKDFTMKKFAIDADRGGGLYDWWESVEANLPEAC